MSKYFCKRCKKWFNENEISADVHLFEVHSKYIYKFIEWEFNYG